MTTVKRESRAVIVSLQGGGMVMFSCTDEGADVATMNAFPEACPQ